MNDDAVMLALIAIEFRGSPWRPKGMCLIECALRVPVLLPLAPDALVPLTALRDPRARLDALSLSCWRWSSF
ncbi:unnamed protein product [Gongylonema pulchrum]|uniref:Secreted protein n=1 Tax=Gongylonema pulchrum TaxID=637853 RepID=A0A183CVS7_9BILA|nr:unnamed protein product [Gongylonema pulchrum]